MPDIVEEFEANRKYTQRNSELPKLTFDSKGSAGRNQQKLAQLLSTYDFVINLLGWGKRPLANFSQFVTSYQASVDAKYHNDFKDIMIALEIEKRKSERKGTSLSISQQ